MNHCEDCQHSDFPPQLTGKSKGRGYCNLLRIKPRRYKTTVITGRKRVSRQTFACDSDNFVQKVKKE